MSSGLIGGVALVEDYEMHVKTAQGEAVVLIPDVSMQRLADHKPAYRLDHDVRIRLLRFVEQHGHSKATQRSLRAQPPLREC